MEWIEVTGRTVEEAVERALDALGVHESELEYEIVDQPRGGFLGLGRTEARIRARVKPLSREKPNDRRRRRRGEGRGDAEGSGGARGGRKPRSGSRSGGGSGSGGQKPARSRADAPSGSRSGGKAAAASGAANAAATTTTDDVETPDETAPAGTGNRSRRRSRPRRSTPRPAPEPTDEESIDMDSDVNLEEQEAIAVEFVQGLLEALGVEGAIRTGRTEDEAIELAIEGDGLGMLVGPKGATLAALEELTRAAVQHASDGQRARLHLDVGGYRQRRREALAEFTRTVAAEVLESGSARALEPMAPADRKVVHDTVAEIDGLATVSEGEDTRRHVVIRPA